MFSTVFLSDNNGEQAMRPEEKKESRHEIQPPE
jgi:hypothetical protein